ncbi:MAG: hypothetical protein ACI92Z_000357 [Paracoccaceae bacterium]
MAFKPKTSTPPKPFYNGVLGLPVLAGPSDAVVFDSKPIPFAVRKPLIDLDASEHLGWFGQNPPRWHHYVKRPRRTAGRNLQRFDRIAVIGTEALNACAFLSVQLSDAARGIHLGFRRLLILGRTSPDDRTVMCDIAGHDSVGLNRARLCARE